MIRSVNQTRTWKLTGSPATAGASALNELALVGFRCLGLGDTSLGSSLDKLPSELWLELSPCSHKAAAALRAACRCKWQGHVKDRAWGTSNYQNKKQVKYVKPHTCFLFDNDFRGVEEEGVEEDKDFAGIFLSRPDFFKRDGFRELAGGGGFAAGVLLPRPLLFNRDGFKELAGDGGVAFCLR